ncbi:MAG: AAA family ATPase [Acidobacteria bacterium]|nr:AAA family ATPase [Acidobacteriota bacterium]
MLERLHIRNFRGFRDLRVDPLHRINLIAGRNDTGKSTLLEAIYLLGSAADPQLAVNEHVMRSEGVTVAGPTSMAETIWKPLFFELRTDGPTEIAGRHSSIGSMSLKLALEKPVTTELARDKEDGKLPAIRADEPVLAFTYVDPQAGEISGRARETADKVSYDRSDPMDEYTPFGAAILKPGAGNIKLDAIQLGKLRKQKRGGLLLDALRAVEPKLQSIEDNSSSGAPMIWVDIGLRELLSLPVMGNGMTHVARIVLNATELQDGVLLVDEIENGLHHSVLQNVWRVVEKIAEQFNVQVFATTHSFECVQAAHSALGADGFGLHRLELVDGTTLCVTYDEDAIDGAIGHNLEVR